MKKYTNVPEEITLPHKGVYTFSGEFEHWRQFMSTYPYKDYWYPVYIGPHKEIHVSRTHKLEAWSNSGFKP